MTLLNKKVLTDTKLGELGSVLEDVKKSAIEYYRLTGKPLGITGEMGEYLAAKHLGLELAEARMAGFDAYGKDCRRVQIKSRVLQDTNKLSGQVGSIRVKHKWDTVVLVLMNRFFEPWAMYEACLADVEEELKKPGSRARNERGSLSVRKFISIATKLWPEEV